MNADKVNAVLGVSNAILGAISILIALAERIMAIAGMDRDEIRAAVADAKLRAADAGRRLDVALNDGGDGAGE